MQIYDDKNARREIAKFGIQKQYKKACDYIRMGQYDKVALKIRNSKKQQYVNKLREEMIHI